MACNVFQSQFILVALLLSSCSRGGLYDGRDGWYEDYTPVVSAGEAIDETFGLSGSYEASRRLYFGSGDGYDEILVFSAPFRNSGNLPVEGEEAVDQSTKEVFRYLIFRSDPLDINKAMALPQGEFDPFAGAECVLTLNGKLQKEDQCDGAAKCKLYRVENIYTNLDYDDCGISVKNFIVKFDASMKSAEVLKRNSEDWLPLRNINHFDAKSSAVRISPDNDPFSAVVATTSADGYVFAGKRFETSIISASYSASAGKDPIDLVGVSTEPFFRIAQTRNVLLTVTSTGIHKLNSQDKWEALPLPSSLAAMPTKVSKVQPANGTDIAAFRITFDDGREKNLILAYRESKNNIEVIDLSTLDFNEGIPSGWSLMIVNDSLWFWHQLAPQYARRFDETLKKWLPVTLTLPMLTEGASESDSKHVLSPAGTGFVITRSYLQKIVGKKDLAGETVETFRKAFHHTYYNENNEQQGMPISTFNAPSAMHVLDGKIYVERVLGTDAYGLERIMDYGLIYDFRSGTGKMFKDLGFNAELTSSNRERLSEFAGIIVNFESVLFYGGCEKPVDIQECISAANPLARLVKFPSL